MATGALDVDPLVGHQPAFVERDPQPGLQLLVAVAVGRAEKKPNPCDVLPLVH